MSPLLINTPGLLHELIERYYPLHGKATNYKIGDSLSLFIAFIISCESELNLQPRDGSLILSVSHGFVLCGLGFFLASRRVSFSPPFHLVLQLANMALVKF